MRLAAPSGMLRAKRLRLPLAPHTGERLMDILRWGIIGLGRFGAIHARTISSLAGLELATVCTRNPQALQLAREEFPEAQTFQDYRELLAQADVDVVTIATHWQEHEQPAIDTLAAGKHLLLEKPMAPTHAACLRVLEAARQAAGMFMVGHVCRFDPRVTLAQEAITAGRLGRIISMHAKRNLPRAPGHLRLDKIPPLMGDGIHDADLMMWFLGRMPNRVYGRQIRVDEFAYPDVGWAMLEFGQDCLGVIETNWRLPANTPTTIDAQMFVVGTAGQLTIDCGSAGLTIVDADGIRQPDTMYWPKQHGRHVGALASEISYFADCIRRGTPPEIGTGADAARAVQVMQCAEQSAQTGMPVELTDGTTQSDEGAEHLE